MPEEPVYNKIAQVSKDSKQLPFRSHVEAYTMFKLLGNLEGKSIIDFACGEGFYTRLLKKLGAKTVLGVDIAAKTLELAVIEERENPIGCEYLLANIGKMDQVGEFDIVTGIYLLNFAKSREELIDFCAAIYKHLRPGGRFVGYNESPDNAIENYDKYKKYGFYKSTTKDRKEGDITTYHFTNLDGQEYHVDTYYYSKDTYKNVFQKCGFMGLEWCGPWADEFAHIDYDENYWNYLIENPPMIGMQAHKP